MGFANSTGCTSVWGSTYPFNPYPFPCTNHLFQDSPSMAMGIFEGHMRKMAEGFKAIRQARLELDGGYDPTTHDAFFTYFDWQSFSDDEFKLCPPVVAVGGAVVFGAILFLRKVRGAEAVDLGWSTEHFVGDVRLGLVEASQNRIGSVVDRLFLLCYHYDPSSRRYAPVAMNIMRVGGGATVLALGGALGLLWFREARRRNRN